MQAAPENRKISRDYAALSSAELRALLLERDRILEEKAGLVHELLVVHRKQLGDNQQIIRDQAKHIRLLEEYLRLAKVQRFGASAPRARSWRFRPISSTKPSSRPRSVSTPCVTIDVRSIDLTLWGRTERGLHGQIR